MATVTSAKVWKSGQAGQPAFPAEFDVVQRAVLQVTDIKSNHNKYYALELHAAAKAHAKGAPTYRLFTHYGRTDDLDTDPDSGQKECRYFESLDAARCGYQSIYSEKTSPRKGYREIALASCRIGSEKARGSSSGEVDEKTLRKMAEAREAASGGTEVERPESLGLHPRVVDLVRYVFSEATSALTTTIAARITAQGIETPLGILTLGQVDKGEAILADIHKLIHAGAAKGSAAPARRAALEELSGAFYTAIPHRIGRSRGAVAAAVIDSIEAFGQKQETLQLMRDMLRVNAAAGSGGAVLYDAACDAQYVSLNCDVGWLDPAAPDYRQIEAYVARAAGGRRGGHVQVRNVYTLRRGAEHEAFAAGADNQQLLFHGSRIQNWVGILSRGILLPKVAVNLGVRRTDAGWLGNGIYFGDVASTSCAYTTPGKRGTRLMALARVALGRVKEYRKITYGLSAPPEGYDSCHGVRGSEFSDDEFVVYDTRRQRLEYLVEFEA